MEVLVAGSVWQVVLNSGSQVLCVEFGCAAGGRYKFDTPFACLLCTPQAHTW